MFDKNSMTSDTLIAKGSVHELSRLLDGDAGKAVKFNCDLKHRGRSGGGTLTLILCLEGGAPPPQPSGPVVVGQSAVPVIIGQPAVVGQPVVAPTAVLPPATPAFEQVQNCLGLLSWLLRQTSRWLVCERTSCRW